jgi:hypothetical protein
MPNIVVGTNTVYMYYGSPNVVSIGRSSQFTESTFFPTSGPTTAGEEKGLSPVLYLKFDEGQGTVAYDSSPNSNHGNFSFSYPLPLQQVIPLINQTVSATSTIASPTDNSLGLLYWEDAKYSGESVYFQANVKASMQFNYNTNTGTYSDIYCITAGDCKMVYYDTSNTSLKFLDCDDATCSSGTVSVLDGAVGCTLTGGDVCDTGIDAGQYSSIACPTADDCKISYYENTHQDLYFADCADATCLSGSVKNVDMGLEGFSIGKTNLGYYDGTLDDVRLYTKTLTPAEIIELIGTP